ncbi:glycosyltransferase family 2 protein [Gramella lutea]|uniref:Glycosyltransferase family 2 protein n=1 Tax=Christiangramia lutea TaxID=1607951 RepID=A0A9X1V084_9FLAO|nr:glycosyltransferase family 2 protein [Christiangramia lutea]MCH4821581.1 glycosyltransferase family 2 protein [Christiangramia lutea]
MRVGLNPEKDKELEKPDYMHHVVIPVHIPHFQDYYKDSFRIFKICLDSLCQTVDDKTFISIINNGSCIEVKKFLEKCLDKGVIHELINTVNIGKLNAILKGLTGYDVPLVTVADSDVFFCQGWQEETGKVFNAFPKAGTVGLVPQFNMFSNYCTNTIFDNILNRNLKFMKVADPEDMWKFYKSIGWNINKDHFYFDSILCIENNGLKACIGSGHFVATYRKELFKNIIRYLPFRLGGTSEKYLDAAAMKHGLWKLTTFNNYAYHMGNVWEDWMQSDNRRVHEPSPVIPEKISFNEESRFQYFLKNKLFKKILRLYLINRLFLHYCRLPKRLMKKYPRIYY